METSVQRDEAGGGMGARIAALDWPAIGQALDEYGNAHVPRLLTAAECRCIARWYAEDARFRSRVVMARHGFGRGEYKYFSYPLPELVAALRDIVAQAPFRFVPDGLAFNVPKLVLKPFKSVVLWAKFPRFIAHLESRTM